jgi:acetyl esterase/lipase
MKLIYDQYVPDTVDPDKDRFISPIYINDKEIDSLPPLRIMVAGMDPLCDQSFIFVLKLLKRGKPVRIYEYSNLPHAYWSVEYPGSEETHEKAMEFVKDLLILVSMKRQEVVDVGHILSSTVLKVYE